MVAVMGTASNDIAYTKTYMVIPTIADKDPWLEPYRDQLESQWHYREAATKKILGGQAIEDFALGHLYFGLHKRQEGWVIREWAPNATALYLISDATNWADDPAYAFRRLENGVWELLLPFASLGHLEHYKLRLHWLENNQTISAERIPSYANYVVQDPDSHQFDAVVWDPPVPYAWKNPSVEPTEPPLIYEAHVGMSGDRKAVSTYQQFIEEVLPRIKKLGYNTVQLMAIQEHPYYGSFGYHVSSFFAASSRFGTPDDLKHLIDTAHGMGLRIILDIVHSHAVKNEAEGLSRFDGTLSQYFHAGDRGNHSAWDSRVFDYGKPQVVHFLLSNIRYWLDEYRVDGFRFDGVTSMLYKNHGLEQDFGSYDEYVSDNVELDGLTYLGLASQLAHAVRPDALLIAEDMSAFPGLAAPISEGGLGFDYRLSMGVPDLWIKTLKEHTDENWDLGHLFHELSAHRVEEKTISYAESHDQALVGDKTLIFRLIDKDMYYHMQRDDMSLTVERGTALHKMIRLFTASTHGGGYLNFMGNEFGHPEWIDFPREGNGWSYDYARRQWNLADNPELQYSYLQAFDEAMIQLLPNVPTTEFQWVTNDQQVLSYIRGDYVFVFNFSPTSSYADFIVPAPSGSYSLELSSDHASFGGQQRVAKDAPYVATENQLKLYIPSRVAIVLRRASAE